MGLDYKELARELLDGGFTSDLDGWPPRDGYMVSPYKGLEECEPITAEPLDLWIECFCNMHKALLQKPAHYIGGWRDGDKLYLDVSVRVTSRADAVLLCNLHNQLAYYDVARKETVYV